jgi:hypothetical protein
MSLQLEASLVSLQQTAGTDNVEWPIYDGETFSCYF